MNRGWQHIVYMWFCSSFQVLSQSQTYLNLRSKQEAKLAHAEESKMTCGIPALRLWPADCRGQAWTPSQRELRPGPTTGTIIINGQRWACHQGIQSRNGEWQTQYWPGGSQAEVKTNRQVFRSHRHSFQPLHHTTSHCWRPSCTWSNWTSDTHL